MFLFFFAQSRTQCISNRLKIRDNIPTENDEKPKSMQTCWKKWKVFMWNNEMMSFDKIFQSLQQQKTPIRQITTENRIEKLIKSESGHRIHFLCILLNSNKNHKIIIGNKILYVVHQFPLLWTICILNSSQATTNNYNYTATVFYYINWVEVIYVCIWEYND